MERPPRRRAAGWARSPAGARRALCGRAQEGEPPLLVALGPGATPGKPCRRLYREPLGGRFRQPVPQAVGGWLLASWSPAAASTVTTLRKTQHTPAFFQLAGVGTRAEPAPALLPALLAPQACAPPPTACAPRSLLFKNEILQLQKQLSNLSFSVFVFPVCRIQLTVSHGAEGKEKCTWLLQCIYSQ